MAPDEEIRDVLENPSGAVWNSPHTSNKLDIGYALDRAIGVPEERIEEHDYGPTGPKNIEFVDIVWGLAAQNRFSGHTWPPINIAQHSVNVADFLEEEGEEPYVQLLGLTHDFHEAYFADTIRPLKNDMPWIDGAEMEVQDWIWESFGIERPDEDEWEKVMAADNYVLVKEGNDIYGDRDIYSEQIVPALYGNGMTLEEVLETDVDIDLEKGVYESMRDLRTSFEDLMEEVYGEEHLQDHYSKEKMDEYDIPGGGNGSMADMVETERKYWREMQKMIGKNHYEMEDFTQ